jgi:hypothetical protein
VSIITSFSSPLNPFKARAAVTETISNVDFELLERGGRRGRVPQWLLSSALVQKGPALQNKASSNLFISENASTKLACLLALAKSRACGQRRYFQMVQEPASIAIPFGASASPASLVPPRPCSWPCVLCLWPCLERGC